MDYNMPQFYLCVLLEWFKSNPQTKKLMGLLSLHTHPSNREVSSGFTSPNTAAVSSPSPYTLQHKPH